MGTFIFANCNNLLNSVQDQLIKNYHGLGLRKKEDLCLENLKNNNPDYIFFLHWSWMIPPEIYETYNCIVFHMTDLPYGRGGSPLQNLIIRGHKETKISALKVERGLDTGPIYLKKSLNLDGKASEIFLRAGEVIVSMVKEIIGQNIIPVDQTGEVVEFTRRKPTQSLLPPEINEVEKLYDFIRMLDADNYPNAFIENNLFKFEFTNAQISNGEELTANVRITKK